MAKKQPSRPLPIRDIHAPATPPKKNDFKFWRNLRFSFRTKVVVAIVAILLGGLFVRNYVQTRNQLALNDPVKLAAKIGEFIELPLDETPTLATVKDANKLKSQPFFKNAQDGDRVLIYAKAGKAVLYRPATKKVIEYSSISIDGAGTPSAP